MLGTLTFKGDTTLGAGVRSETWPAWQRFKLLYLSADGGPRAGTDGRTTPSASQAYALFFALIANDRAAFDEILRWTQNNLAAGSLESSLPSCSWRGLDDDARNTLGPNSASDANLWIVYSLGEAARLWREPGYSRLGAAVARNIIRDELAMLPGLGAVLLPRPWRLATEDRWRLNAGYLPLPIIRGVARQTGEPGWTDIATTAERIVLGSAPRGFAADWVEFTGKSFSAECASPDDVGEGAIRVYLWAGMLPASDATRDKLCAVLKPALNTLAKRSHTAGFSAALLPMLANARMSTALQIHRQRAAEESLQNNQQHSSDALALFGLGWLEQRYRFNGAGLLSVRWTPAGHRTH